METPAHKSLITCVHTHTCYRHKPGLIHSRASRSHQCAQCAGSVYIWTSLNNAGRMTSPLWLLYSCCFPGHRCLSFLLTGAVSLPFQSSISSLSLTINRALPLLPSRLRLQLTMAVLAGLGNLPSLSLIPREAAVCACDLCLQLGAGFFVLQIKVSPGGHDEDLQVASLELGRNIFPEVRPLDS